MQVKEKKKKKSKRSSCCVTIGSVASLQRWDTGSIPSPAQWVKDPVLPQLWHRSPLWFGSEPWPGNSKCREAAKTKQNKTKQKKKKKRKKERKKEKKKKKERE